MCACGVSEIDDICAEADDAGGVGDQQLHQTVLHEHEAGGDRYGGVEAAVVAVSDNGVHAGEGGGEEEGVAAGGVAHCRDGVL